MNYPKERELTGVYVFVERDGERIPMDFTDLTEQEMFSFLKSHMPSNGWMVGLVEMIAEEIVGIAKYLADEGIGKDELIDLCAFMGTSLHLIGDSYEITKAGHLRGEEDHDGKES